MANVLGEMTWVEAEEALKTRRIALLPVGSTEQHGHHLPLATDYILAEEIAKKVAEQVNALVLPGIPYGPVYTFRHYAGTIGIRPETLQIMVEDVCRSVKGQGIDIVAVIIGHLTDVPPVQFAARNLREEGMLVLYLFHPGLDYILKHICETKRAHPRVVHAAEVETSLMLALRPDLCQMDKAKVEYPDFPVWYDYVPLSTKGIVRTGTYGDATAASAEKGKKMVDVIVSNIVKILRAVEEDKERLLAM
ncbi:MAG: creatininase family protein [Chloroflexi bacterium]|nr:creatininase family protein [Chloroflexota bacterium]